MRLSTVRQRLPDVDLLSIQTKIYLNHSRIQVGDRCYRLSAFPLTFNDAAAACDDDGADLAEVTASHVHAGLRGLVNDKWRLFKHFRGADDFWIGLELGDGGRWRWRKEGNQVGEYQRWQGDREGK